MNNQAEIIKPGAVSNDTGAATNVANSNIPESAPAVTDNPNTATNQGDAGNAQTTNQSDSESQATPDVPTSVKLELPEEQADMIQTLLSNYVIAYRSDSSVDYKPEPIPREKVGHFPYVATAPAPEIINPTYDWINKKWYSKNGTQDLSVVAANVASLIKKSAGQDQVALANGQQTQMITQHLGAQTKQIQEILQVMGQLQQVVAILAKGNQAQTTAPTQPTTDNKQTSNAETTNGGNN